MEAAAGETSATLLGHVLGPPPVVSASVPFVKGVMHNQT